MPRLLIRTGFQGHQKFELRPGQSVIGRGEGADVIFPNVSVSRHHCLIDNGEQRTVLEDMESANGTFLNGKQIQQEELKTGDEIQIGKFHMVFLGDQKEDLFYRGRYVQYLPSYEPLATSTADNTFAMTREAMTAMANQNSLVSDARLILANSPRRFWYPEDRKLTFGTTGMIDVDGWFTWGKCAEVAWDGGRHVLIKRAWFTTVKVNDRPVRSKRPLKVNDSLVIGNTRFTYIVD